mmetsp:Transcript_6630/g.21780  ORF Transcript_6630/g.21780 Transcript_6630/m.21780 type:complete len:203 (-) Transcript_6630:318-926(-)
MERLPATLVSGPPMRAFGSMRRSRPSAARTGAIPPLTTRHSPRCLRCSPRSRLTVPTLPTRRLRGGTGGRRRWRAGTRWRAAPPPSLAPAQSRCCASPLPSPRPRRRRSRAGRCRERESGPPASARGCRPWRSTAASPSSSAHRAAAHAAGLLLPDRPGTLPGPFLQARLSASGACCAPRTVARAAGGTSTRRRGTAGSSGW